MYEQSVNFNGDEIPRRTCDSAILRIAKNENEPHIVGTNTHTANFLDGERNSLVHERRGETLSELEAKFSGHVAP